MDSYFNTVQTWQDLRNCRFHLITVYYTDGSGSTLLKQWCEFTLVSIRIRIQSGSSVLMTFRAKKRTSSTSKDEIYWFFSIFLGHFCPLGSGYGSRDPIESGSTPLPGRLPWGPCVCDPIRGVANCGQDGRTCRLLHQAGISVLLGTTSVFSSVAILFVSLCNYLLLDAM